jgi:hypothetical protein
MQELTARIARLRERLRAGDPDMASDEIQAAIDRAEDKRQELLDQQPAAKKQSAKVLNMLPKPAETARREIAAALGGDSSSSLKARTILRDVYLGKIQLRPLPGGGLCAHWNLRPLVLLKSAAAGAVPCGSGGKLRDFRNLAARDALELKVAAQSELWTPQRSLYGEEEAALKRTLLRLFSTNSHLARKLAFEMTAASTAERDEHEENEDEDEGEYSDDLD